MPKDVSGGTGLKWTNIPMKYAVVIIAAFVVVIFGTAIYGPVRWRTIATSVNEALKGKPVFADIVALPKGGVTLVGKVKTARDLADLESLVDASHVFPVYVNYRVSIEGNDPAAAPVPSGRE